MIRPFAISDVRLTAASEDESSAGLLAYLSVVVDDRLVLDGITLRRAADGRLTLAFPERRTERGRAFPLMRPRNEAARAEIEAAIFDAIRGRWTP